MTEFHSAFHQKAKELIPEFLYEQIKSVAIPMSGAATRWKMSAPSIFEKIAIPHLKPDKLKGLQPKELKDILGRLNKIFQTAKRSKEDTNTFIKAGNWVVQEMRERKMPIDTKLAVIQEFVGKSDEEIAKVMYDHEPPMQAEAMAGAPKSVRGYTSEETFELTRENGKFSQEQANYVARASCGYGTCTSCRFFVRGPGITGVCQVVEGEINWFGTSDLHICAWEQSSYIFHLAEEQVHSSLMDQALGFQKAYEAGGSNDDNNTDPKKPEMEIVKAKIRKRIRSKDGKFEVTDDSGKKILGTHASRADAIRQLAAIENSKLKQQAKAQKSEHEEKDVEKGQPSVGAVHQPGSDKKKDEDEDEEDKLSKEDVWFDVPIAKIDTKKQKIYGVVLEPDEIDTQDDTVSLDEVEKAAEGFMSRSRRIGLRHRQVAKGVDLTDSYVTQGPTKLGKQSLKVGTWIIGVKVSDPALWAGVENGEYNGFSVGGHGKRRKNA